MVVSVRERLKVMDWGELTDDLCMYEGIET